MIGSSLKRITRNDILLGTILYMILVSTMYYIEREIIIDESIIRYSLQDSFDEERINLFLNRRDNMLFVDLSSKIISSISGILLISLWFLGGLSIWNINVTYKQVYRAVLLGSYIYLVSYGIKLIWFLFNEMEFNMKELKYF
jgi:hypothetical protein